jgi:hypothetical protein
LGARSLLGEQHPARERESKQHEAHGHHPEQESFEREQRRHARRARIGQVPAQSLFQAHEHERLQRRDEEQCIGDECDADVQRRPRFGREREVVRMGYERRQHRGDGRDRQHDGSNGGQRPQKP